MILSECDSPRSWNAQVLGLSSVSNWTMGEYLSQSSSLGLVLVCFAVGGAVGGEGGDPSSGRVQRLGAGLFSNSVLGGDFGDDDGGVLFGDGEDEGEEGEEEERDPLLETFQDDGGEVMGLGAVLDASLRPTLAVMLMAWPITLKGILYAPLLILSCR
jgi:hypothetical protein